MPERFAVIGFPVAHSRSPDIHAGFAEQTGVDLVYERIECEPRHFDEVVSAFFKQGGRGLNVTAPHKRAAFVFSDRVAMRARIAGSVNTLTAASDQSVIGDNTDGAGLVRDLLDNLGCPLRDAHILLLGAGGAARGVAAPLLSQSPASLTIANRTHEKAVAIVESIAGLGPAQARRPDALHDHQFDLVINATSGGFARHQGELSVNVTGALCYDMSYAAQATPFMDWAAANGARAVADGWGMLVEQAAESFYIWHRTWPRTADLLRRRPAHPGSDP